MYKHLLIPLDGSSLAETVFPAADYFARMLDAVITLLHVVEQNAPGEIHGDRHLTEADEASTYLDEAARRGFPPEARVDCHVIPSGAGGVAKSIVQFAEESAVDLITMCTHGRSGVRHLLSGSNAQQVVGSGRIPVLQIRPQEGSAVSSSFNCSDLLVPLDGSPEHEAALVLAARLSAALHAGLHLLLVVPTRDTLSPERAASARLMPGAVTALLDLKTLEAREYLRGKTKNLENEGLPVSSKIGRGDPAEVIVQMAEQGGMSLIVFGTHRKAGTNAFWSGSIAPKVSNRSRVPVLLIPLP